MIVQSDRSPVFSFLINALKLAPAAVGAGALLLAAACSSSTQNSSIQASNQEMVLPTTFALSNQEVFDTLHYCANGQTLIKKDLDTGLISNSSYKLDGKFCTISRVINSQKTISNSFLGMVPSLNYTNFDEINSKIVLIVVSKNVNSVSYDEYSSFWGAPSWAHMEIIKVSSNPVVIDKVSYPSVQLLQTGRDTVGTSKTELTYSENKDGTYFISEVKSRNPNHIRENFQVIGLIS